MPPVRRLGLKSDERLTELRLDESHADQGINKNEAELNKKMKNREVTKKF